MRQRVYRMAILKQKPECNVSAPTPELHYRYQRYHLYFSKGGSRIDIVVRGRKRDETEIN